MLLLNGWKIVVSIFGQTLGTDVLSRRVEAFVSTSL